MVVLLDRRHTFHTLWGGNESNLMNITITGFCYAFLPLPFQCVPLFNDRLREGAAQPAAVFCASGLGNSKGIMTYYIYGALC